MLLIIIDSIIFGFISKFLEHDMFYTISFEGLSFYLYSTVWLLFIDATDDVIVWDVHALTYFLVGSSVLSSIVVLFHIESWMPDKGPCSFPKVLIVDRD